MAVSRSERRSRASKRFTARLETLDDRMLLATGVEFGHTLGPYIAPATIRPRVTHGVIEQNAQTAINNYLAAVLGEEALIPIQRKVHGRQTGTRVVLTERILKQDFVRSLFSNRDTYELLNSRAVSEVIGVNVTSDSSQTETTVRYLVPAGNVSTLPGASSATVVIPDNQDIPGFIADVPLSNIRLRSDGFYAVDVPRDQMPANPPPPLVINVVTGRLSATYLETGDILENALLTGAHRKAPNAPRSVPGLRLSKQLGANRAFPNAPSRHRLIRLMRNAVQRDVFRLSDENQVQIDALVTEFLAEVDNLNQAGYFTPATPPSAPAPVTGPLNGSLIVTVAAIRDLNSVAASKAGLPLAQVSGPTGTEFINLSGRIDVGYVITRTGDFGIILTARGPLNAAPGSFTSANTVGGDIRIQVSNTATLSALSGERTEEGLTIGAALESTVNSSNQNGISIWGTSVGYGSGFQYGTSNTYTRVLRLGNINALLPLHPKN